jgi:serine/threonine-protein kinase
MIRNYLKILLYLIGIAAAGSIAFFLVTELVRLERHVDVPLLIGKSVGEAEDLLRGNELTLTTERKEYHHEIPEGKIISQDIEPGESVERGATVSVIVSRGAEIFSMPSFEGQQLEEVKMTLDNLGMELGKVTRVHSDSVMEGGIIAQRPFPGYVGSNKVNFLVSLGPYSVSYKCPSLVNMSIRDARDITEALGLKLIEHKRGARIIFQKPEAGTIISRGDTVEVTLGRGWGLWF